MRCVQRGNICILDHECFPRPGPRLIEAVEMMAALFRNNLPMEQDRSRLYAKWSKGALKYECRTKMSKDRNDSGNDDATLPQLITVLQSHLRGFTPVLGTDPISISMQ